MEKLPTAEVSAIENIDIHELREALFLSYANEQLLDVFEDALCECDDLDVVHLNEWQGALASLEPHLLQAFLAVPHELMQRRVTALVEQAKKKPVSDVVRESAEQRFAQGYRVGYHCTNAPIAPSKDAEGEHWVIDGREPDHRDGDLGMAYYSMDLAHLFHKKKPQYIYLVIAHTGEDSVHRQDNNGAWGRAPKLDVITSIDYKDALVTIDERTKAYIEKSKSEE